MPAIASGRANASDGDWHFYAWVVPKGATLCDVKVYMDGVELTEIGCSSGQPCQTSLHWTSEHIFKIGYRDLDWFEGTLDEVRVYNYALSSTDIMSLYNTD